ncbi:MAG: aminoacyl-tRNA hydrolase [Deltaproteobacteria bacterium]|nr:aminoacyl-tRNA hydrolase [Deltaproteobacteria bacterium]
MKALIGLGNPGKQYRQTRHNAGFLVVERLAEQARSFWRSTRYNGVMAQWREGSESVVAGMPHTYMNLSGDFVAGLLHYYKVLPADLLVIHDEMDLPLGRLRLARGGSGAGHRGIESVLRSLGSETFARLRIGVGKPDAKRETVEHVLSPFCGDEAELFSRMVAVGAEAVACWVREGLQEAMNRFNGTREGGEKLREG